MKQTDNYQGKVTKRERHFHVLILQAVFHGTETDETLHMGFKLNVCKEPARDQTAIKEARTRRSCSDMLQQKPMKRGKGNKRHLHNFWMSTNERTVAASASLHINPPQCNKLANYLAWPWLSKASFALDLIISYSTGFCIMRVGSGFEAFLNARFSNTDTVEKKKGASTCVWDICKGGLLLCGRCRGEAKKRQ